MSLTKPNQQPRQDIKEKTEDKLAGYGDETRKSR